MTQIGLDFNPVKLFRRDDPDTSYKAASQAKELRSKHHSAIVGALAQHDGQTIYDLAESTGLDHYSVARRMKELEQAKLVSTEGERPGKSGRMCRIWYTA